MPYATSSDYLAWTDVATAPAGLARVLEVASTRVDELIVGAVYLTDTAGNPTDLEVAEILKKATCEQALYMFQLGDTTGAKANMKRMDIGRISWQRAENPGTDERYAPGAVSILHTSSVLPIRVIRLP